MKCLFLAAAAATIALPGATWAQLQPESPDMEEMPSAQPPAPSVTPGPEAPAPDSVMPDPDVMPAPDTTMPDPATPPGPENMDPAMPDRPDTTMPESTDPAATEDSWIDDRDAEAPAVDRPDPLNPDQDLRPPQPEGPTV